MDIPGQVGYGDSAMNKEEALKKLREAIVKGEVDEDIIPLLEKINSMENYYTTSSCSGRIVVMEIEEIGDKKSAKFLGKWHKIVEKKEVIEAIGRWSGDGYLFLIMQSPIIHVRCSDEKSAFFLIQVANECGFKYSSLKSKYVVEILSTEQMHVPLGKNSELWVNENYIEKCVEIANKLLKRAKSKLKKLEEEITKIVSSSYKPSSTL